MLEYQEAGRGGAVLLLHGFALDGRLWKRQIETLSVAHRVVAPTLPDFGPRPHRVATTTTRAIIDLMDGLGIESAHLVGLSLGGAIAVDLALSFSARVRSLTLVDALLRGRPTGLVESRAAVEHAKAGRLDDARHAWLGGALFASSRAKDEIRAEALAMTADYDGAHWLGTATTTFEVAEHESRLGEIGHRVLVIVGEHDTPAFRAMSDAYAEAIPNARKLVLRDAGHLANLEAPEAFDEALRAFVSNEFLG